MLGTPAPEISTRRLTDEVARQIAKRLGSLALTRSHFLDLTDELNLYALPLHMVQEIRLLTRKWARPFSVLRSARAALRAAVKQVEAASSLRATFAAQS